jgi:outer membrane protein insertion porin family
MRLSVFLCCLIFSATVGAQPAPQFPPTGFDGQNVSAVSLIANPHRDLEPYLSVVVQKANTPYSTDEIRASVEALKKAGGFRDIHVRVLPDIAGLRVSFMLEPAYYLGMVRFPGAERRFSYTRLLQISNLSDEDPFDASLISAAQAALTDFLHKNGYFQSQVHAETQIDDPHQLVNVSFVVDIGEQARISSVEVNGPDQNQRDRLLRSTRSMRARLSGGLLKPGRPYSSQRINSATRLMRRSLTQQRRLTSTVRENPPQYDAQTNRVGVSFAVKVGPTVTVEVVGASLSWLPFLRGRQMRRLIPIFSEATVDRDLVDEGQRNLTDFFQKRGFYDVKVTSDFRTEPSQMTVVYTIDRGQKYRVSGVVFHGNNNLPSRDLMAQVTVRRSRFWSHGSLSQQLLRRSADNVAALYRDHGYEQVKVTWQLIHQDRRIGVAFEIEEGPQTLVADVSVTGNDHVHEAELTAPLGFQLRAGVPFSPRRLADDRNRISATYLNRGYLNAEVRTIVDRDPDNAERVHVTYAITEHQLVTVSGVVYLGQEDTRLSLIAKTARLPSESPMRRQQLLEAESRLFDLNIFDWASVGPRKPITDQDDELALVKVHEATRNEITYGFGFEVSHRGGNAPTGTVALPGGGTIGLNGFKIAPSQATFASPRGTFQFSRRNLRGLGETANLTLLLARLDQKFSTSYSQPHFNGSQWQSLTSFSAERNSENPLFTAGLGDLAFQLERVVSHKTNTRVQLRYEFNITNLTDLLVPELVLPQDRHVHLSTLSGSLIRDTRDKPLDAHRGVFSTINLGITPTVLGSSASFIRFFGQYARYKQVGSVVFANSLRLGLAAPYSNSFVPTSELFFTGGGTTLRGFPINQAGPQRLVPFCNVLQGETGCVNITVPVGGRQLVIVNSEVRFPMRIVKALGGVFFYDGGNVYSAISLNEFVNNYTNTFGFGLRYQTPIGPVRFDVGRNLSPVPGLNPTQYFITIGQAF